MVSVFLTVLAAWVLGGILPLVVAKAIVRRLPNGPAWVIGSLVTVPLLLVVAVVLEIGLGYW